MFISHWHNLCLSSGYIILLPLSILKILIDHVCAFVERNQVPWLDLHSRRMEFKRSAILMEVMVTIECFRFKEKYQAKVEGRDSTDKVDNQYYLLATFDAIMNTMTKANGKKVRHLCFGVFNN